MVAQARAASPDAAGSRVLVLFDFDGTITTRETLPDFLRMAAPRRRLAWGRVVFALPVLAYRLRLLPVHTLRAWLTWYAFSGLPKARIEAAGRDFAAGVLPALVRPEMQARINAHRACGDTVVVVSGGFDVYLAPWCEAQGLILLCSALETRDGRLTGRYAGAQCVAGEKVRRVLAAYDPAHFDAIHAHGDTVEDLAMLALADVATFQGRPWPDADRPARDGG